MQEQALEDPGSSKKHEAIIGEPPQCMDCGRIAVPSPSVAGQFECQPCGWTFTEGGPASRTCVVDTDTGDKRVIAPDSSPCDGLDPEHSKAIDDDVDECHRLVIREFMENNADKPQVVEACRRMLERLEQFGGGDA